MSIELTYTVRGLNGVVVLVTNDEKKAKDADKTVSGTIELRDFILSNLPESHGIDDSIITNVVINMFDNKDKVLSILKKGKTKASPMLDSDLDSDTDGSNSSDEVEKTNEKRNESENED